MHAFLLAPCSPFNAYSVYVFSFIDMSCVIALLLLWYLNSLNCLNK